MTLSESDALGSGPPLAQVAAESAAALTLPLFSGVQVQEQLLG